MKAQPSHPMTSSTCTAPPSDVAAVMVWTLGQAAIVAAYAGGVKPAGGYPAPVEATADIGLACGQLVLAVCFAPVLFATPAGRVRVAAVGTAWTVLAALLADRSAGQTTALAVAVVTWCAVFAVSRRRPAAALALLFLTMAGPVLFYLSIEYGPRPLRLGDWPTLLSPTLGVCTTRLHNDPWRPLIPPVALLLTATVVRVSQKISPRRNRNG